MLAGVNGIAVTGYGVYSVYAGESAVEYICFDPLGDAEASAVLATPESLRFTIRVYDEDTSGLCFAADVNL